MASFVQQASAAFAAPTVVHFSVVLLLSAVLRVPANVIRRARLQTADRPDIAFAHEEQALFAVAGALLVVLFGDPQRLGCGLVSRARDDAVLRRALAERGYDIGSRGAFLAPRSE